ncbi:MAG TPA: molybdopterin-dependent oxidoreductase [Caulobacteraceae bacterium]|jgi:DMSO/TMAO reductase YedYZ molybdopterin-dependent catalytic subunit
MSTERRAFLGGALALASASILAGCDKIAMNPGVNKVLGSVQGLNRRLQRLFWAPHTMAREYRKQDISAWFKPNGAVAPDSPQAYEYSPEYHTLAANGFKDWRLVVDGLVDHPLSLSLDDLRAMAARTQITRHDCVEGWSCIGQWSGVQLARVLSAAKLKSNAKYVVFHCADVWDKDADGKPTQRYYESLGLDDAVHPQTILAYDMNGQPLPVPHGAPLRLRVERQLGYKHAKYLMRIEAVESFAHIGQGGGGYWEDNGYEWYAGI